MKKLVISSLIVLVSVFLNAVVKAGVPLSNLEGVGGVAFNPLAYPANPSTSLDDDPNSPSFWKHVGKPQLGSWYVHLGQSHIDWTTIGVSETFFKRLEVSYGHEIISVRGLDTINKDNLGLKFLLLEEGDVLPAVSFGTVFKQTTFDSPGE